MTSASNGANLGFENELWKTADALRNNMGADPEDLDDYKAKNIFWVPPEARWLHIKAQADINKGIRKAEYVMVGASE